MEKIFTNTALIVAILSWFSAQSLKVILLFILKKTIDLKKFVSSGGMPSSHTATVFGLSTAIGISYGWETPSYALSLIFSIIVMYDASGVRKAVGNQAQYLNNIKKIEDNNNNAFKEQIGHTYIEVFAGAILGILIACLYLC